MYLYIEGNTVNNFKHTKKKIFFNTVKYFKEQEQKLHQCGYNQTLFYPFIKLTQGPSGLQV